MRVVVWIAEAGWEACVDAALAAAPADADVTLLAVPEDELAEVHAGGRAGLLGRRPPPAPAPSWDEVADAAAAGLLDDARARLGREARTEVRHGRVGHEVVAACAGADLLVCSRDGDDARLGPKSLGRHARFVVDHAPCAVLLVWPEEPPGIEGLPPPPPRPPHER
jgi:nucleotide-binding universal stress UspA family protein